VEKSQAGFALNDKKDSSATSTFTGMTTVNKNTFDYL